MSQFSNRVVLWPNKLVPGAPLMSDLCPPVQVVDSQTAGESVRFTAVVSDANNRYPYVAGGEVDLLEGRILAGVVDETIAAGADQLVKRPIVAIIDAPSQAYGRREGVFGIHQALVGAAGAYTKARFASHPVVGLIVGKAMSGAFLTHGYRANCPIIFNDSSVLVHAMGREPAARTTLRTVEALEKLAATIPPMVYDVSNYATLGLLSAPLDINNSDAPDEGDLPLVSRTLRDAIADVHKDISPKCRLGAENRRNSQLVRDRMHIS